MQTLREKGVIQVWSLSDGLLSGTLSLGVDVTTMACSPIAPVALVGTTTGFILAVDVSEPDNCRVILRSRPFNGSISRIT